MIYNERDLDIHGLDIVNREVNSTGVMHLLVTGSWAIEGLTQTHIHHNDVDTNVFCHQISSSLAMVSRLLDNASIAGINYELQGKRGDRLDYDVNADVSRNVSRRFELHFIESKVAVESEPKIFRLMGVKGDPEVPTELVTLKVSDGKEYQFRAKSKNYLIATWAIRISGLLENEVRPIRQTDLDAFGILIEKGFDDNEVEYLMKNHPQMPENISTRKIMDKAIAKLSEK